MAGWLGRWLGGGAPTVVPPPVLPAPIPTPIVYGDPAYVDHVRVAVGRLPEQYKRNP